MSSTKYPSITSYIKSQNADKIKKSQLQFANSTKYNDPIVDTLTTQYNRNSHWTENHVYRFLDDLYGLFKSTNGDLLYSPSNSKLANYFKYLFQETSQDFRNDKRIYGNSEPVILGFPNSISYQCMRSVFLIDPEFLEDGYVNFVHRLYTWLEESAITGTRLHSLHSKYPYTTVRDLDMAKILENYAEANRVKTETVELDRLSNTHIIMLWK